MSTAEAREFMVDAIIGAGFPDIRFAYRCEQLGLADFVGDTDTPAWTWRKSALEAFSKGELDEVYLAVKSCRTHREIPLDHQE